MISMNGKQNCLPQSAQEKASSGKQGHKVLHLFLPQSAQEKASSGNWGHKMSNLSRVLFQC
jgi:hypothetical protein